MQLQLDTSPIIINSSLPLNAELIRSQRYMHIPGQASAIRFFDPSSGDDFTAMQEILKGEQTKKWMEDVRALTHSEYRDWAGTRNTSNLLFSVHSARMEEVDEIPRGFVYLYQEFMERRRIQRMTAQGLILPSEGKEFSLEVSFAARPANGQQSGSGLMSSAVREACLQALKLLKPTTPPNLLIFAFVDQENISSHHTLESAGFLRKGVMKYDRDSYEENFVYTLDWPLLEEKIKSKLP